MKRVAWLLAATCLAGACAGTSAELQVINDAAEAVGGADKIQAVNSLVFLGTGTNRGLGQNRAPDADLPILQVTGFRRTLDLANERARLQQTRVAGEGTPEGPAQTQDFGVDGYVAFNVGPDGFAVRQPERVAIDRRHELILHHPVGVLRAALDPAAKLASRRTAGNRDVVDITTGGGENLMLAVDSTTHLPVSVTSMLYNVNLGDVALETTFADYQSVDGLMLPARISSKIDRYPNTDLTVTKGAVNLPTDFAVADAVKSSPAPLATANVTVEQVGTGVWLLAGQSHNSVLVEFSDHTELIEVPQNDTRTLAVIAKARELKPDKPLTKAVVTHHHFDHSGGIRAAVAEGLALVTHETNKPFFEEALRRRHTIVQDALARNPRAVTIETVGDQAVVRDTTQTMQLYKLDDPTGHTDSGLMVYLPNDKLLVQADFFNTAGNAFPRAPALNENVLKRNLRVEKHVPIHGPVATHAAFTKIVQAMRTPATNQSRALPLISR